MIGISGIQYYHSQLRDCNGNARLQSVVVSLSDVARHKICKMKWLIGMNAVSVNEKIMSSGQLLTHRDNSNISESAIWKVSFIFSVTDEPVLINSSALLMLVIR